MAKSLNGQNFVPSKPKKTRQGNGSHSKPSHGRKKYQQEFECDWIANIEGAVYGEHHCKNGR